MPLDECRESIFDGVDVVERREVRGMGVEDAEEVLEKLAPVT